MDLELYSAPTAFQLPDNRIVAFSDSVSLSGRRLSRETDYEINYDTGILTIEQDSLSAGMLTVSYYAFPDFLSQSYYLYEVREVGDSLATLVKPSRKAMIDLSDNKLLVSGSKTFALTFSNLESYDLKQSLYMNLSGELSPALKIEGRLSDSQSALTPEGDSREISSLDQIYLKLYGKQYYLMLGDQDYEFSNTHLMRYKTKFEGFNLKYDDKFMVQGALAINGGKPQVNVIQGVEGKQGPYYLTANTTGQTVQVIAGSEKISVNGNIQQRGTDYTIDYAEGTLTFKILVTSNSRIMAEFQYSDDYYSQNLYLNSSSFQLRPGLKIGQHLIKQTDNRNNPLQWNLTSEDIDSLRNAGDGAAWGQGVYEVEPGNGIYVRRYDSENNVYYDYEPADTTANYLVYFSFVGTGLGDYESIGNNKYKYIGKNQGSYMPFKKLIAPIDKTNIGMFLRFENPVIDLWTEGLVSSQDENTFSNKNDKDNSGGIISARANLHPQDWKLSPQLSMAYLHRTNNTFTFSSLTPENEHYEFSSLPEPDSLFQDSITLGLRLSQTDSWEQLIITRYRNVKGNFIQKYIKSESTIRQRNFLPYIRWYGIMSNQTFVDSLLDNSILHYHLVDVDWRWKALMLKMHYFVNREEFDFADGAWDSQVAGRHYGKLEPQANISDQKTYSSTVSFSRDKNDIKQGDSWSNLQRSDTWQLKQTLSSATHNLSLDFTHRNLNRASSDSDTLTKKISFDLANFRSSHQLWNNAVSAVTSYQLNQLEFYPKIRELNYVGEGLGQYDSTGVLVESGDYDYYYVNSGASQLSSDINASLNLNIHVFRKSNPQSLFNKVNLDTNLLVTENTTLKNDWHAYLLWPDALLQNETTLYGKQVMQNVLWLDIQPKLLAANFRHEINKTLDNRYQEASRIRSEEMELEMDWKQLYGYQLRASIGHSTAQDNRYDTMIKETKLSATIYRNVSSKFNSQSVLSYAVEGGESSIGNKRYQLTNVKFNPFLTWYPNLKYRVNVNLMLQYNQRSGSDLLSFLPDKRDGFLFTWSLQTQLRLNSYSSGFLEYSGNSYPDEASLHKLKMEFRAEL